MEIQTRLKDIILEHAEKLFRTFKEDRTTNNYPVIVYESALQEYKYYSLDEEEDFLRTAHHLAKDKTYGVVEDRHFDTLRKMESLYGEKYAIQTLAELLENDVIFRYKEAQFYKEKQKKIEEKDYFSNGYLKVSIPKDECKFPKLVLQAMENKHSNSLHVIAGGS